MPTLVLLPGMDGTGELFADFVDALPRSFEPITVQYPADRFLSYTELKHFAQAAFPVSGPFMLVAESFSTPLAIQCAATRPPNLCGLVLCAGFTTTPVAGWRRWLSLLAAPILCRSNIPEFVAKRFLLGPNASAGLLAALRVAVTSVRSSVLAARIQAVLRCDVRAELAEVAVPILYIQARQDRVVRSSCLDDLRRIKPDMSVAVVEGPHLLLQREPHKTADIVVKFASLGKC